MSIGCESGYSEFYYERCYRRMSNVVKNRYCNETGFPIHVGERYVYISGKFDGEFWTFKQSLKAYHLCRHDTVKGSAYCEQHHDKKCCVCGAQATHDCSQTGIGVCGAPLCDNCEGYVDSDDGWCSRDFSNHKHRRIKALPESSELECVITSGIFGVISSTHIPKGCTISQIGAKAVEEVKRSSLVSNPDAIKGYVIVSETIGLPHNSIENSTLVLKIMLLHEDTVKQTNFTAWDFVISDDVDVWCEITNFEEYTFE